MREKRQICLNLLDQITREDTCLAFSGGVDSSLLLALLAQAAWNNRTRLTAVTFQTVLHPASDIDTAKNVAAQQGVDHVILAIDETENPVIMQNPTDRCYQCKKMLFLRLIDFAAERGCKNLVEGTNKDDEKQYRPGMRALEELGVLSPLRSAGLTKAEIRSWAKELGISVAERPSAPCMATRLPYGDPITHEKLDRINRGEAFLKELGFSQVRLRLHGNIARIEIEKELMHKFMSIREEICSQLKQIGFVYITLDLEGFRSGSMDVISVENDARL